MSLVTLQMSHIGWLRLVGSLKLSVSFAEYRLFCRALLQKRPIIWSLPIVATPYHVWMNCVTSEWVMSRMNELYHIWKHHVTYVWVMSDMNESCHVPMSHVTYEWVMSRMKESCQRWMSRVTYGWVMSFSEWVVSYKWVMSRGNEPCPSPGKTLLVRYEHVRLFARVWPTKRSSLY